MKKLILILLCFPLLLLSQTEKRLAIVNGNDKIELADIYIKRAEVYKNAEAIELMCADYQKACDLGDCKMFNKNCK